MRRALLSLLGLAAGCFSPQIESGSFTCGSADPPCPPGLVCSEGLCVSAPGGGGVDAPASAFDAPPSGGVDAPRAIDAAPLPDGFSCAPSAFLSCKDADTAIHCNTTGNGVVEQPCPVGCDERVARRCLTLVASNVPAACDPPSSSPAALNITADTMLNTDNCVVNGGLVVSQGASAPELCVFRHSDVSLAAGATLTARGRRALVVVALRKMIVAGTLDAGAKLVVGGPGSDPDRSTGRGISAGSDRSEGGGGGGHATAGGNGGAAEGADVEPPGGVAIGNPALLSPLTAGGFGGAGGTPCPPVGPCTLRQSGGAGGGAVQLVACAELEVRATAVINAGGGGGNGGAGMATTEIVPGGGDGGGAGGGVLIEAPQIVVPAGATLVANGGGGGGGGGVGDLIDASGKPGGDGPLAERPATGGEAGSGAAGKGGAGGASGPPDPGDKGISGGGGGGAAGRIRLNARPDRAPNVAGSAIVSPDQTSGAIGRK